MELIISAPSAEGFTQKIEWNHEEIKAYIQEKTEVYNGLIYDEDQIKEAKADKAELNKMKTELENKRKELKKKCLAPYEAFEKREKELVAMIEQPAVLIDNQIKGFEEKKKAEKRESIIAYFNTKDFHGFTFEEIEDPKWLNVSTSMKSISDAIDEAASNIEADLEIINGLPEYSFEALEVYKRGRDVRAALAEAKRLTEQAKAKAEWEAKKAAEEKARQEAQEAAANIKAEEEPEPIDEPVENEPAEPENEAEEDEDFLPDFETIPTAREWVAIKAFMAPEDMEPLKAFFDSYKIPFEIL